MEAPTPHLLLLFLLFAVSLISASLADDGAAMLALAKSFRSPPSDWSTTSSTDYCRWTGVLCTSGRVTSISLADKSLKGWLAPEISALSELGYVALQRNKLSGKIPSFAKLSSLQEIYMDENLFTGVEPGAFDGLASLQILSLSDNANLTSWSFPSELADSTWNLTAIYLENTQISGILPDIFDSFASLENLRLSYNNITGPLPPSLAKSSIQNLWINNQQLGFSGTIEVLSGMTSLSQAWLHKNQFVGPIPDLSKCESLYDLQLMDNKLTGIVSPSLFSLGSLKNISLDNNRFQGPLPSFPPEVERVSARHNYFCTTKAGQSCSLQVMTLLAVAGGLGYPSILAESWQGDNACSGWAYVNCDSGGKNVVTLNLGKHGFAGFLSPAIANLTYLRGVFLNDNNLTGAIPKELGFMTSLELIDVSNNNLTGELPSFPPTVKFTHAPGNVFLGTEAGDSLTTGTDSKSPGHSTKAKAVAYLSKKKAGIGLASGLLGIILVAGGLFCLVKWRRKTSYDPQRPNLNALIPLKRYSYVQIKRITNSFAEVVGKGGFGTVYRGTLWDGRGVAVKVLKDLKGNGEDFINEVASMSKTSHVNIVSLLGFCSEGSKKAIIYEFLENGSLDQFISTNTSMNMDWMAIYGIALGVARGVEYLHHGCKTRIVHFDIKPQNVLLDGSLCPKVSDFGLARLCEKNESILSLLDTRGTIGYIAPELFSRMYGRVSHKSDVYSYGMLVLEMIGARRNEKSAQNSASNASSMYFPEWIYKDLEKGDSGKFNGNGITCEEEEIAKKMKLVGLWCIQPSPSDRPPMNRVVEMMEGSVDALGVPPRPVFQIPAGPLQEPSTLSEDISV